VKNTSRRCINVVATWKRRCCNAIAETGAILLQLKFRISSFPHRKEKCLS